MKLNAEKPGFRKCTGRIGKIEWRFGMKCHVGVDAGSGLAHTITVTAANEHDITQAAALIREDDEVVYGVPHFRFYNDSDDKKLIYPKFSSQKFISKSFSNASRSFILHMTHPKRHAHIFAGIGSRGRCCRFGKALPLIGPSRKYIHGTGFCKLFVVMAITT